jgi:F-type H+-transporting ATPase subunit delta
MAGTVADVYAESLFELAEEAGVLTETAKELTEISIVLSGFPELKKLLTLPTVTAAEKQQIIHSIFGGRVSETTENFLMVLALKRRVSYFEKITAEYSKRYHRANGLVDADVKTSVELTDAQKQALEKRLSEKYNKKIKLHCTVDPALMGGMVVNVGGRTFDGSVKNKLDEIKQLVNKVTI